MVIEIPKGASEKKIKSILQQKTIKKNVNKSVASFFGKLPEIQDGLKFQKKYEVSGNNLLLDTNIIIYALKGLANVKPYFYTEPFISVITEMEILGVKEITPGEIKVRETAIEFCSIIPLPTR